MERTNVAAALIDIRQRRGLTQEQVAKLVGRTPGAIGALETDRLKLSPALLATFAQRLELTPAEVDELAAARVADDSDSDDGPTLAERVAVLEARLATLEAYFAGDELPMAADRDPTRTGTGRRKKRPRPPVEPS